MLKRAVLKAYHSPYWIPGLSVVAVAALMLASFTVVQFIRAEAQDDRERVEADVASCERGNVLRSQTADVGAAADELVAGVVDGVVDFAQLSAEERKILWASLAPLFEQYRAELAPIVPVDCGSLVPGGSG